MSDEDAGVEPALVDAGDLVLADLALLDHPVLARALRRVLADVNGSDDPLASFESSI
jgi:FXSXX-COOH protein